MDTAADTQTLLEYIHKHAPNSKIFLWAHSIGTGVAGVLYRSLQSQGKSGLLKGILLDAPFDKFKNAAYYFEISTVRTI